MNITTVGLVAVPGFAVSVFAKLQRASFYRFAPPGEL